MAEDRFEKGREALFAALNMFFGNKNNDEVEPGEQPGRPSLVEPPSLEPRPADRGREPLLQLTPTSCSGRLSSVAGRTRHSEGNGSFSTVRNVSPHSSSIASSSRRGVGTSLATPTRFFASSSRPGQSTGVPDFFPNKGTKRRKRDDQGAGSKSKKVEVWKKECVCLANHRQLNRPNFEERLQLVKMGLGPKMIYFELSGNAAYVYDKLVEEFPALGSTGGYTLLRLKEDSKTLTVIDSGSMSVLCLKDILKQAKMFVRPLQRSIVATNIQISEDSIPMEVCLQCNKRMPLQILQEHLSSCTTENKEMESPPPLPEPIYGIEDMHVEESVVEESVVEESVVEESVVEESVVAVSKEQTLSSLLRNHKDKLSSEAFEIQEITVRRHLVWEDTKVFLNNGANRFSLYMNVEFAGEPACDGGGPCREYFRLAISDALRDPMMFQSGRLIQNTQSLMNKMYLNLGQLFAASVFQGGPGPSAFPLWIYSYFCTGLEDVALTVTDITCQHTKELMEKMMKFTELDELKDFLMAGESSVIFDSGFAKPVSSIGMSDTNDILKAVAVHHEVIPIKSALDQLKEGLQLYDFLSLVQRVPETFRHLFVIDTAEELSLDSFLSLFEVNIFGNDESVTYGYWQMFVEQVAKGEIETRCLSIDDDTCTLKKVGLVDVLSFCTGSSTVPPIGFENLIYIGFSSGIFPTSGTCGLSLYLPVDHKQYDSFKSSMLEAIITGAPFGCF